MIAARCRVEQDHITCLGASNRQPCGTDRVARGEALSLDGHEPCSALLCGRIRLRQTCGIGGHLDRVLVSHLLELAGESLRARGLSLHELETERKRIDQHLVARVYRLSLNAHATEVGPIPLLEIFDEDAVRLDQYSRRRLTPMSVRTTSLSSASPRLMTPKPTVTRLSGWPGRRMTTTISWMFKRLPRPRPLQP